MKKKLSVLFATLLLVFTFSATCFAASSPTGDVLPNEEADDDNNAEGTDEVSNSSTSPKTGYDIAGAFVAVFTAAGVSFVAKKKFAEAE